MIFPTLVPSSLTRLCAGRIGYCGVDHGNVCIHSTVVSTHGTRCCNCTDQIHFLMLRSCQRSGCCISGVCLSVLIFNREVFALLDTLLLSDLPENPSRQLSREPCSANWLKYLWYTDSSSAIAEISDCHHSCRCHCRCCHYHCHHFSSSYFQSLLFPKYFSPSFDLVSCLGSYVLSFETTVCRVKTYFQSFFSSSERPEAIFRMK